MRVLMVVVVTHGNVMVWMTRDVKCSCAIIMLRFTNLFMKIFPCDNYIMHMWVLMIVVVTRENVIVWMTRDVKCSSLCHMLRFADSRLFHDV